jgi:hypothetical protein
VRLTFGMHSFYSGLGYLGGKYILSALSNNTSVRFLGLGSNRIDEERGGELYLE